MSESTPVVTSFTPTNTVVYGASTVINFSGSFLNTDDTGLITIDIGGTDCLVTQASDASVECDVSFVPVGTQTISFHVAGFGNAQFESGDTVWSSKTLDSIDPSSGSLEGGQTVTIAGNGFIVNQTLVLIDDSPCEIQSLTLSQIICITPPHAEGSETVTVTSGEHTYTTLMYESTAAMTPVVSSLSPTTGQSGDNITITGTAFSDEASEVTVIIDFVECSVTSSSVTSIECTTGSHSAGTYFLEVHVGGKGIATSSVQFEYSLSVGPVTPDQGKFIHCSLTPHFDV